jgi:polyisoprenyl-phosphate glycosyltransferase
MPHRFAILAPVLDDWESLRHLIEDIDRTAALSQYQFEIIAIDDGSINGPTAEQFALSACRAGGVERIEILRIALNLGHQRAIAVGLSSVAMRPDLDAVIVMDADGEDRPDDIPRLIDEAASHPGEVIVAHRAGRSEGPLFKSGYWLYKKIFRAMTGKSISFGNFALIPMPAVQRLVHMPELWNNLPASIVRSRLRYRAIHTNRGVRYAGVSRMNVPALIVHGLSAMAVYVDIMFVRVVLAAAAISAATLLAMAIVVAIRLATSVAIPGWATTAFGDLLVVLFQVLVIVVAVTFMVLSARIMRPFVPIADTAVFIAERIVILETRPRPENVK